MREEFEGVCMDIWPGVEIAVGRGNGKPVPVDVGPRPDDGVKYVSGRAVAVVRWKE